MSALQFLLLEDKLQDTKAIQSMLTDGGINHELLRVDTRADFVTALKNQVFDLILAAYALPGFDGITALEIANNLCPDVPFIFVSASLGEEVAIETLKRGATDYVLKQRLGRLVLCVQRALQEAQERRERKQAEQMLVEQKQLLELIASGQPLEVCLAAVCASVSRLSPRTYACFLQPDVQQDLCEAHGTLACHCTPVLGADGLPLGSLMLAFDEARLPTPWENQLANFGTQIASIAFERDRASLAVRQNEARFRTVAANLPNAAVFIVDHELRYLLAEGKALQEAGLTAGAFVGKTLWEALDPILAKRYEPSYRQALGGESFTVEHYSHDRYYVSHGAPLRNNRGEIDAALVVSYDISDRKQTEADLRESEARFRLVVDSAKEYAIFTLDLNGMITSWNAGAERLVGYQEAEIIGCHGSIIFTPEDIEQGKADLEMKTALAEGQAINERWHVRKDGSRFWGSGLMMPLQSETGDLQGLVKIMQDKTAQRQADERFRLLYNTTSDLLATEQPLMLMHNLFSKLSAQLDLHCYYSYLVEEKDNRPMLHLRSYGGIADAEAYSIEWIEFGQYLCGQVAQERQQIVLNQAQIATHPNAKLLYSGGFTAYAGQPLIVQGQLLGTLSFASRTRISFTPEELDLLQSTCDQMAIALERANLIQSIQQQAEELQRANQVKDEFLAVLSHELRSPLNPILGWARMLQSGKLDAARQADALATIERNALLQSQLIEDLLDISRIMQGKLLLTVAPVNLTYVIAAAVETVRLTAEAKNIRITLDIASPLAPVSGDSARLQQVVWNLLTNATKFTPNGGQVTVELRQLGEVAQLRVMDTGKGIHASFLPHVFEYFRQEDGSTTRRFGGLGLGLAIVRQIVEMHGGTVTAESQGENQGATFIVQLPVMQQAVSIVSEQARDQTETETPLENLQILLVDDDPDTRQFQAFLLQQKGAIVTAVDSGLAALQALEQFIPDVLVSDVGMPDIDGYMLIQQIRLRPAAQGGTVPAIALTAYAAEVDRQKALQAGFQTHVTKPVEPAILVEAIASLLKHK
ncbi:response regulator [Phormidium sp. FACHB-592]|uniref:histidine kinase n=1 Tax=Stenomitos frigidus AS-A4 TaxID=2933935 RepID=A0ABV0KQM5_9CYAN|nr:response regulator [Phormidium sp. FACHB-592]MBD2075161.1 response regulator [Phormidium sp. FACHB-592]